MKDRSVSVAEGKKGFSRLVQETHEKNEKVIITKRRKPVAVIVSYDEYRRTARMEGYRKIMKAREIFSKAGLRANDIIAESKEELESRP